MRSRVIVPIVKALAAALLLASAVPAAGPQSRPDGTVGPDRPSSQQSTDAPAAGPIHFRAVNVYVDTGDKPLAAYQFDLTATAGNAKLVGLEGGDAAAFKAAPYYDPRALLNNRVIVAAFSTAAAADLPRGWSRVATLHVEVSGDAAPAYAGKLTAAATADGNPIADAHLVVTPVPEGARP